MIPAKGEFVTIARQVLLADVVKRPHDAALNQAEKALTSVDVGRSAVRILAGEFLEGVVHNLMLCVALEQPRIRGKLVGVDGRGRGDIFIHKFPQVFVGNTRHNFCADVAAALNQCHNRSLLRATPALVLARAGTGLAADISFVNFHRARQFILECRVFEGVANLVHHQPSRAVAAKLQRALNLQRTDTLFGTAQEIPSNQPFTQRDMGILENRPHRDGELPVAVGTVAKTGAHLGLGIGLDAGEFRLVRTLAVRANNPVLPTDAFKIFAGRFIS